jgi:hypothetical protein
MLKCSHQIVSWILCHCYHLIKPLNTPNCVMVRRPLFLIIIVHSVVKSQRTNCSVGHKPSVYGLVLNSTLLHVITDPLGLASRTCPLESTLVFLVHSVSRPFYSPECIAWNGATVDEWWIEKYLEASRYGVMEVLSLHYTWIDWGKSPVTSFRITSSLAEVWTPSNSEYKCRVLPLRHLSQVLSGSS